MQDLSARLEQFEQFDSLQNIREQISNLQNYSGFVRKGFASSVQSRSTQDCVRNDVFQRTYTLTQKQSNKSIDCMLPI